MLESIQGPVKVVDVVDVCEADLISAFAGGGVESGGGSHENSLVVICGELFETPLAEAVGVVDRHAGNRTNPMVWF